MIREEFSAAGLEGCTELVDEVGTELDELVLEVVKALFADAGRGTQIGLRQVEEIARSAARRSDKGVGR